MFLAQSTQNWEASANLRQRDGCASFSRPCFDALALFWERRMIIFAGFTSPNCPMFADGGHENTSQRDHVVTAEKFGFLWKTGEVLNRCI
jgi:hypothetical protein